MFLIKYIQAPSCGGSWVTALLLGGNLERVLGGLKLNILELLYSWSEH